MIVQHTAFPLVLTIETVRAFTYFSQPHGRYFQRLAGQDLTGLPSSARYSKRNEPLPAHIKHFFNKTADRHQAGRSPFLHAGFVFAFLCLVVGLLYANILQNPFVFDDAIFILGDPSIRLTDLSPASLSRAASEALQSARPVANISFGLNYYFHQYKVMGFHVVNLLIHVVTGFLLYLFVKTTLSLPPLRDRYSSDRWLPLATALIWLLHPLQTQAVTYTVQRMTSLAAMFYLLAMLCYAKARLADTARWKYFLLAASLAAGLLALGSKETAATLPFFILLYEWYFFQDLEWAWLKRHSFLLLAVALCLGLTAAIYLGINPLQGKMLAYGVDDFTVGQRLLTEARVVIFYISLILFPLPSRLNIDHAFGLSNSLLTPASTFLAITAIAGLAAVALLQARRQRLLSFCILWFLGNLVIESTAIKIELIYEHRNYLPSMLVVLLGVTQVYRYIKPQGVRCLLFCTVAILCGLFTFDRNKVWSNEVSLWQDSIEKSPNLARPHNNLGVALSKKGRYAEAIAHYGTAIRLKNNYLDARYNMAKALYYDGRYEETVKQCRETLRLNPYQPETHLQLGMALKEMGRVREALEHYRVALQMNPQDGRTKDRIRTALNYVAALEELNKAKTSRQRIN